MERLREKSTGERRKKEKEKVERKSRRGRENDIVIDIL